ncbi:hypothetical protein HanHA300_Chr14g0534251 [Helianthus annuus]|nr:hypothetical protein HanHA300_Chr14g0534251 [Helianthus annuus]KAJ0469778.1 hypothetical protein HanIR_Chr14g0711611 [Helianthus annuus]KAJ0486657.1 hypothetical protein HanHA89_Chr14g0582051 [Helianthus annuus]KAJ0660791.1 hypothetical protein HanOQP8_Chr14g0541641 [Helianthus annuus]
MVNGFGNLSIGTRSRLLWPLTPLTTVILSAPLDLSVFCCCDSTLLASIAHELCQSARLFPIPPAVKLLVAGAAAEREALVALVAAASHLTLNFG